MYNPSSLARKVPFFVALLLWPGNANPPPSRGRQIDEGIKTTPKYFETQTEQSIACVKAKPAKNLVESSVQLVPIKNETLFFSCGAGIPDPSEVRTQRGFPYPGTYCSHKVKPTPSVLLETTPCSWSQAHWQPCSAHAHPKSHQKKTTRQSHVQLQGWRI